MAHPSPEDRIRQGILLAQAGQSAAAHETLLALSTDHPNDPRIWMWLAQTASNPDASEQYLQQLLHYDPANTWAILRLETLAADRAAAAAPINPDASTGDTEELQRSGIVHITNAPLPTPDPWQSDSPGVYRCPFCAQSLPGERRCIRCGQTLGELKPNQRLRNLLDALGMLLVFRSLVLVFSVLITNQSVLMPWNTTRLALAVALVVCAVVLRLWWWPVWWLTLGIVVLDTLAPFALLITGNGQLTSIRSLIITAVMGLLTLNLHIALADRWRKALQKIDLPPATQMPKTPIDAMNAGVSYSHQNQWYLAARMWQRAVALRHHEHQYRRALGLAYLHLQEYRASLAELHAAETLEPDDAKTQDLLATAEAKLREQT